MRYTRNSIFKALPLWFTLVAALVSLWLPSVFAQSANSTDLSDLLAQLPRETQSSIEEQCLPVQYNEGAAAYRSCVTTAVQTETATDMAGFESLSFDEKYAVQQACGKDRRQNGQTYHECLKQQVAESLSFPPPDLSEISDDESYVLQQSCFNAQTQQGAAAYRQCINDEIASLQLVPLVDLTHLSSLDRNAIQMGCSPTKSTLNAADYRLCLAQELASSGLGMNRQVIGPDAINLQRTGVVSISTIASSSTTASPTAPAVDINPRLSATLPATTPTTAHAAETAVAPKDTDGSPLSPRIISKPQLPAVDDRVTVSSNPPTALESASDAATVTAPTSTAGTSHWLYTIPLVLLLAALQGLYLLLKRRPPQTEIDRELINPPIDFGLEGPAEVPAKTPMLDTSPSDGWQFNGWQDDTLDPIPASDPEFDETMAFSPWQTDEQDTQTRRAPRPSTGSIQDTDVASGAAASGAAASRVVAKTSAPNSIPAHSESAPRMTDEAVDEMDQTLVVDVMHSVQTTGEPALAEGTAAAIGELTDAQEPGVQPVDSQTSVGQTSVDQISVNQAPEGRTPEGRTPTSPLGRQLAAHTQPERIRQATEFLLYWISYGDGNIDPDRARQLLQDNPRDEHDLIKRWVLQKDASALADALNCLQTNCTRNELEQTLCLLMSVLIAGDITPVQNTLFRFLADIAGVGTAGLQRIYRSMFGRVLPAMPRPDSSNWWQHQNPAKSSTLSELGLPENPTPEQIERQHALIERRFDPIRFDQLGEKEQRLAQRHAKRHHAALDALQESVV